jgi:hypothetical protein
MLPGLRGDQDVTHHRREIRQHAAALFALACLCAAVPAEGRQARAALAVGATVVESCAVTTRQPASVTCGARSLPAAVVASTTTTPSGTTGGDRARTSSLSYLTVVF